MLAYRFTANLPQKRATILKKWPRNAPNQSQTTALGTGTTIVTPKFQSPGYSCEKPPNLDESLILRTSRFLHAWNR